MRPQTLKLITNRVFRSYLWEATGRRLLFKHEMSAKARAGCQDSGHLQLNSRSDMVKSTQEYRGNEELGKIELRSGKAKKSCDRNFLELLRGARSFLETIAGALELSTFLAGSSTPLSTTYNVRSIFFLSFFLIIHHSQPPWIESF
jgi:hypothetical protein